MTEGIGDLLVEELIPFLTSRGEKTNEYKKKRD